MEHLLLLGEVGDGPEERFRTLASESPGGMSGQLALTRLVKGLVDETSGAVDNGVDLQLIGASKEREDIGEYLHVFDLIEVADRRQVVLMTRPEGGTATL